jgi:PAS domain S-box-containing protein
VAACLKRDISRPVAIYRRYGHEIVLKTSAMIWQSKIVMTAIDLFIVGFVSVVIVVALRMRVARPRVGSTLSSNLTVAAAGIVGAFYLVDVVTMHALPRFIGDDATLDVMTFLHLELRWFVTLIAVVLVGIAFMLATRGRQRYEAALEADETRYKAIVEDQTEFIVRWQPGGIRTWVNDRYCNYFEQPREKLLGTSFLPLIDTADQDWIENQLDALTPDSPYRTGIHKIVLPKGGTRWHEWTDRAIFDERGQIVEMQSVGRDVTEKKLAEDALAESETWLRDFVESTSDWVWEMGLSGNHIYSNPQVEPILGITRDELYGMGLKDLVHPDDMTEIEAKLPRHIGDRSGWRNWVIRFRHRNGSYRYIESSAIPVLDTGGEVRGFRGVDRDVTFRTLLARLSKDLLETPANELHDCIGSWMELIGLTYLLDRTSLWWLEPAEDAVRLSHRWNRRGPAAQSQRLVAFGRFPWITSRLLSGSRVVVETPDDIPPDAAEDRNFVAEEGIVSTLGVPLHVDNRLVGFGAFATVEKPREWHEPVPTELTLLAETLAGAYQRSRTTEELRRRERELARSGQMARIGSYSYVVRDPSLFPEDVTTFASREISDVLGVDAESTSFDDILERILPEDVERELPKLLRALSDPEISGHTNNYRIRGSDGSIRYIEDRDEFERNPKDGSVRVFGTAQDVTDRMRAEQELRTALDAVSKLKEQLQEENIYLREEVRLAHNHHRIIGNNEKLKQALIAAEKVAPTDVAVLILGETGTGKELVANTIHELSDRANEPLISVNCAALSASLIESELFGHERGAFTGAQRMRKGRFEVANGGTLFLDEIGELPLELQAKILRVLQSGTFERLGGSDTLKVDVRLIAATNRNLKAAVDEGVFRADLYYRIASFPIRLPPLRERRDDIPILAEFFVRKHADRLGKSVDSISARSIRWLSEQRWPGNVRELEGFIERSLISMTGRVLDLVEPATSDSANPAGLAETEADGENSLHEAERRHIRQVLDATGWMIAGNDGAANRLGVPPSTLRSKMKRLGLTRPARAS